MNQTTLTDQPSILRLLLEQGVDGEIKPADETRKGAFALFPDINTENKWYIVDKREYQDGNFYVVVILDSCTTTEAVDCLKEYIHRFNGGKFINGRLKMVPKPEPVKN